MSIDTTHPRPFLQRPWTSLDGTWEFTLDSDRTHRDPSRPAFADVITVPFAPETPASGVGPDRLGGDFVRCCWYRRTIDQPLAEPGERVLVHFGGVDRIADVWIDGHHVAHHEGGYTAFSADISDHVRPGSQLVVRAVDDPFDLEVPRGKQDWRARPHAIWYPPTTGIWKTVWIERVPDDHVAEIDWVPDVAAMTVTMHARIEGPSRTGARLGVRLGVGRRVLVDDEIVVDGPTVTRTFPIGDGGFDDRVGLAWFPTRPTLIEADLELRTAASTDRVRSYTALRSVTVSDGQLRLNGRPYPLRLVLDQGYWPESGATPPDVEALARDIELTKALGFNGVRKHQKVEDARYFALADTLGLLCWVEMPSAYKPGPRTAATVTAEWADVVRAHRNHPSVIAWVPVNESWGVPDCEGDTSQRSLLTALSGLTHALDGTRPVSTNDGWETVGGEIVGVHDYDRDPAQLRERWSTPASVDAVLTGRRPDGKLADLEQRPAAGRAVILSEFGGIAMATDTGGDTTFGTANWGYDHAASASDLLGRYRALWAEVHGSAVLAGACWTQLTDTYQEVNGLLRADRTPKAELAALAAATRGRPA